MNSLLQRVVIYAIVILICSVYCVLYFVPLTSIKTINAIGIANLVVLALLTWLLVRPRLFQLWGMRQQIAEILIIGRLQVPSGG